MYMEGEKMKRGINRKLCATCEHWTGKRIPVFDVNGNPKLDILDTEGNCENVNSRFLDTVRNLDRNCNNYSKWTELL